MPQPRCLDSPSDLSKRTRAASPRTLCLHCPSPARSKGFGLGFKGLRFRVVWLIDKILHDPNIVYRVMQDVVHQQDGGLRLRVILVLLLVVVVFTCRSAHGCSYYICVGIPSSFLLHPQTSRVHVHFPPQACFSMYFRILELGLRRNPEPQNQTLNPFCNWPATTKPKTLNSKPLPYTLFPQGTQLLRLLPTQRDSNIPE